MIIIRLKDAPAGTQTWRVMFGPGAIWASEYLALGQQAALPVSQFSEPYRSGVFDWFFIFFYDADGRMMDERFWPSQYGPAVQLQPGKIYQYSYAANHFYLVGDITMDSINNSVYSIAGLAAAGLVIGWGWKGIQAGGYF